MNDEAPAYVRGLWAAIIEYGDGRVRLATASTVDVDPVDVAEERAATAALQRDIDGLQARFGSALGWRPALRERGGNPYDPAAYAFRRNFGGAEVDEATLPADRGGFRMRVRLKGARVGGSGRAIAAVPAGMTGTVDVARGAVNAFRTGDPEQVYVAVYWDAVLLNEDGDGDGGPYPAGDWHESGVPFTELEFLPTPEPRL